MEVADVGVPTGARASLAMAPSVAANSSDETVVKRRKIPRDELKFSSSSYAQLRSRRRRIVKEDSKISSTSVETENSSSSPSSDSLQPSCCFGYRSSELDDKRSPIDLEVESSEVETSTSDCRRERRETSPSNQVRTEINEHGSTKMPPSEHNFLERATVEKMPTELEIEEFFTAAEKDIRKKFEEKYNYDIVKDVPLEGRYEWVPLKQKQ